MDESRAPAEDPDEPSGHTRRWVLGSLLGVLAGGGAGVATEFLCHRSRREPAVRRPPAALTESVAAEQRLLADLDATTGGSAAVRLAIVQVRADHAAHLRVLRALAATYDPLPVSRTGRSASAASGTTAAPGVARSRAQLREAELRASAAAVTRARRLAGSTAAVLASIAACEATHSELLG